MTIFGTLTKHSGYNKARCLYNSSHLVWTALPGNVPFMLCLGQDDSSPPPMIVSIPTYTNNTKAVATALCLVDRISHHISMTVYVMFPVLVYTRIHV